jgi:hypothetical protein
MNKPRIEEPEQDAPATPDPIPTGRNMKPDLPKLDRRQYRLISGRSFQLISGRSFQLRK